MTNPKETMERMEDDLTRVVVKNGEGACAVWAKDLSTLIASHKALVEAGERSLRWLTSYPGGGTLGPNGPYEQMRAAILNATGGQPT